jgi:hypothetical protein
MQGDIAFSGFMLTADEWAALDTDTRAMLEDIETAPEHELRRFPTGTEPPPMQSQLAEGSGPLETGRANVIGPAGSMTRGDYIDLFSDDLEA